MELDDIFFVGKRPTTLRLVLGLMEDADSSLEKLSKYVEDVFEQKGLIPYKPLPKEGLTSSSSAEETLGKMKMDYYVMRSKAKMALEELMALKDAKGDNLFCQKNHWWAVFRIFVDLQVCGIRENRYKEFIELMMDLRFDHVNAELDMTTLSNITQDIYRYPFTRWELKIPKDASSRWKTAYERMYQIADKLNKILIAKGF